MFLAISVAKSSEATGLVWQVDPVADVITTAGDLLYGTAADTVARLGIGTAGQVLKVNSGATAPEWGAAAGAPAWTLTASGTLSSTQVSVTGIDAAEILVSLPNFVQSSSDKPLVRVNSNSTSGDYGVQYHENNTGVFLWGSGTSGKSFCYINGANTTADVKFGSSGLYNSYIKINSAFTSVQIVAGGGGTWTSGDYEVWTR